MYFQPIDKPQALKFVSSEHARVFEQHCRNVQRVIRYNNKRIMLGLRLVTIPEALMITPASYAWPIETPNRSKSKCH